MNHDLFDREDGLAHCKVCRGAEASMPYHCPGRAMTAGEQDAVMAGRLHFFEDRWWAPGNPGPAKVPTPPGMAEPLATLAGERPSPNTPTG